jgi:2'-5' RNA ligase
MICGAAFIFDDKTEAGLRASWQRLADAGVSNFMLGLDYPPHLTLFLAEAIDMTGLGAALAQAAAEQPPLPVIFSGLGVFPAPGGVIFLNPTTTHPLLDLHARFWQVSAPYLIGLSSIYQPGVWVPHVTLGFRLPGEKIGAGINTLLPSHWPRTGNIVGLIYGNFNLEGGSQLERVMFG